MSKHGSRGRRSTKTLIEVSKVSAYGKNRINLNSVMNSLSERHNFDSISRLTRIRKAFETPTTSGYYFLSITQKNRPCQKSHYSCRYISPARLSKPDNREAVAVHWSTTEQWQVRLPSSVSRDMKIEHPRRVTWTFSSKIHGRVQK